MPSRFREHRYFAVKLLMNTSNAALYGNLDRVAAELTAEIDAEIEKAMEYAGEMVAEVGGRIIDAPLIEIKPFAAEKRAWVLIEVIFTVDTQHVHIPTEGLELYEHQNLYLALADGKIERMEMAPRFRGHMVTVVTEKVGEGTIDYYLVNIGGELYMLTKTLIKQMEDEQDENSN